MDINSIKNFIKSQISADTKMEKVRSAIKQKQWEKQDKKEGFKEALKPISKANINISETVEKEGDRNIEQLQKNQNIITQGLIANRKALEKGLRSIISLVPELEELQLEKEKKDIEDFIKDYEEKEEELAYLDMFQEGYEDKEEKEKIASIQKAKKILLPEAEAYSKKIGKQINVKKLERAISKESKTPELLEKLKDLEEKKESIKERKEKIFDEIEEMYERARPSSKLELAFSDEDIDYLTSRGYPRPSDFSLMTNYQINNLYDQIKQDTKNITGKITGSSRKKKKTKDDISKISELKNNKKTLFDYKNAIENFKFNLDEKIGSGIYLDPATIVERLDLLGGSILAGNNGVKQEFSQLAHLLKQMKIISTKQLNDLLKIYLNIK